MRGCGGAECGVFHVKHRATHTAKAPTNDPDLQWHQLPSSHRQAGAAERGRGRPLKRLGVSPSSMTTHLSLVGVFRCGNTHRHLRHLQLVICSSSSAARHLQLVICSSVSVSVSVDGFIVDRHGRTEPLSDWLCSNEASGRQQGVAGVADFRAALTALPGPDRGDRRRPPHLRHDGWQGVEASGRNRPRGRPDTPMGTRELGQGPEAPCYLSTVSRYP